jgi:threonine 3-dehydrogenase
LGNAIDTVLVEDVAGKTVLVTGCDPIGLLAIGIARASGATCIFTSEVSAWRRQLAERMGATWVITHRFPLGKFDQALALIAHGECGKVLLIP